MEKILIVDDQVEVLEYLTELLGQSGYKVTACGNAAAALETIDREGEKIGLAILDLDLGHGSEDGFKLIVDMKSRQPDIPIIILTAQGGARAAVQAMKLGAADFLEKDTYLLTNLTARMKRASEFLKVVKDNRRLLAEADGLRQEVEYYRELSGRMRRLVGRSNALRKCLSAAESVALAPRPVLIRGERGTGKELVAAYIHQKSPRATGPFIAVNCAAFSGNLLESEMFGHEKGAFTGAAGRKLGRFELADKGTLFLDEIGNMSLDFQEMILRVVEYQKFERVQGTRTVEVDCRIIAATNAPLEEMMTEGRFRRDLYDRLAFKEIHVPPLRERTEDIPALVEFFVEELRREVPSIGAKRFTPSALEKLMECPWPGNIRQIKNAVERIALESVGATVDRKDLGLDEPAAEPEGKTFFDKVDGLQRNLINQALSDAKGNQRAAARATGMTYDQFRHYFKKFKE